MGTICGIDCSKCWKKQDCKGCGETEGHPFGGDCVAAECIKKQGKEGYLCYKKKVMDEINSLHIPGMPEVTELTELAGSYVNLMYPLQNGHQVRLLDDTKVYLGYQLEKEKSDRCFGLVADDSHLLVCEYGRNGADPEIVVYKRRWIPIE